MSDRRTVPAYLFEQFHGDNLAEFYNWLSQQIRQIPIEAMPEAQIHFAEDGHGIDMIEYRRRETEEEMLARQKEEARQAHLRVSR